MQKPVHQFSRNVRKV